MICVKFPVYSFCLIDWVDSWEARNLKYQRAWTKQSHNKRLFSLTKRWAKGQSSKIDNNCSTPAKHHRKFVAPTLTLSSKGSMESLHLYACQVGHWILQALLIAQLWDWRKSPETITETSMISGYGILQSRKKVLEWHSTMHGRWQAKHDDNLHCWRWGGWNWHQDSSSVTRDTSRRACPSQSLGLMIIMGQMFPFDNLAWRSCSGLRIRTVTTWGGGSTWVVTD